MSHARANLVHRRMEINRVFRALTGANVFRVRYVMEFLARQYGVGEPMIYQAIREMEKNPVPIVWENTTLVYRLLYTPDGEPRPLSPMVMDILDPASTLTHIFTLNS